MSGVLAAAYPAPATIDDFNEIAIAYILFALTRPGLFRVMFAEGCDCTNPDRVAAVAAITGYVKAVAQQVIPTADPEPLATALWALIHGLAFLRLDGKLGNTSADEVADIVWAAVSSIAAAQIG